MDTSGGHDHDEIVEALMTDQEKSILLLLTLIQDEKIWRDWNKLNVISLRLFSAITRLSPAEVRETFETLKKKGLIEGELNFERL